MSIKKFYNKFELHILVVVIVVMLIVSIKLFGTDCFWVTMPYY